MNPYIFVTLYSFWRLRSKMRQACHSMSLFLQLLGVRCRNLFWKTRRYWAVRRAAPKALRVVAEVGDNHVIAAVLATYRDAGRLLQQSLDISTFWAAAEIQSEARQLLLELGAEEEGVESEEKVEEEEMHTSISQWKDIDWPRGPVSNVHFVCLRLHGILMCCDAPGQTLVIQTTYWSQSKVMRFA